MRVISDYLGTIPDISETEKAKLEYVSLCLLYEVSKIILFLIIFSLTGRLDSFIYSMIILLPLRIISGGLHFKHYLSCFAFSLGYFYLAIVPLSSILPDYGITLALLCICVLINCCIGPVTSASRPSLSQMRMRQSRIYIFLATLYGTILTALFFDTALAPVGFWTIMLHSLQLVIAKLKKNRGETYV